MPARSYGQFCAVARSLDVVGDRWSMLLVRELLHGQKRYGDLLVDVPGISTDVLAARLRSLVEAGVVERDVLPAPAGSRVYRLTARGRQLEEVVDALARWGGELLTQRRPGDEVRPHWIVRALRARMPSPPSGTDVVVRFELPEGAHTVHLTEAGIVPAADGAEVDVVVTGTAEDLAAMWDPAVAASLVGDGQVTVVGALHAVRQLERSIRG